MVKQLLRTPLQQAMVLVWVAGLLRISDWLNHADPTWSWVFAVALSTLTLGLIAVRFRKPGILPACVVLGMVLVVAVAERVGIGDPAALITVTALYALLAWRITILASDQPLTTRLVRLLMLSGGYGAEGGRLAVERVVHWSCFSLILLTLAGSAVLNMTPGVIPLPGWPILVLGILFMWLSAERYRLRRYAYLLIASVAWAVVAVYVQVFHGGQAELFFHDPWPGFVLALYSLGLLSVSSWLARKNVGVQDHEQHSAGLYIMPLRVSAVIITAWTVLQTLALVLLDTLAAPVWSGVLIFALCSGVLLIVARMLARPSLSYSGTALMVVVIVWCYDAAMHGTLPLGLWPTGPASGDQWLVLALVALMAAAMALHLNRHGERYELYHRALFRIAWLSYGWSIVGALGLLIQNRSYTAWVFAALIAGSIPLFRPMVEGVRMRGLAVALLASLFVASLFDLTQLPHRIVPLALSWAYGLWLIGNLLLPPFNARIPQGAVGNQTWPWLGLLALVAGLLWDLTQETGQSLPLWSMILLFAGYSFLMLRNSRWPGFSWLAVFALTAAGVVFAVVRHQSGLLSFEIGAVGVMAFETLILANVLLIGASLWQRHGQALSTRLGLQQPELRLALQVASLILCLLWLLVFGIWDATLILMPEAFPNNRALAVLLGGLLSLSFLHLLWSWSSVTIAQLLICSIFLTALAAWAAFQYFHLPLALALWGVFTITFSVSTARAKVGLVNLLHRALMYWVDITVLMALILLVLDADVSTAERITTLSVVSSIAVVQGIRLGSRRWLFGAAAMIVVLLHGIWLLWIPWTNVSGLLPWYALQFAVIACGLRRLERYIQDRGNESISTGNQALTLVGEVITSITPLIGALAVLEWLMHALTLVQSLLFAEDSLDYGGRWGTLVALLAAGVLIVVGIGEARRVRRPAWVYGVATMIATAAVYCRLLWVGLAPLNVWDTVALMTAAYLLFILQRMTLSRLILNTMMILPMLALMTVPFQLGSAQAGLTLLAAATLYLLTRQATGMRTPMYLGMLALNGSIYLWVPGWAQHYGLFQVYLIPAALSVLLLLHLHRHELNARVLNGMRLVALCTLYAVATLDVFIQEQLMVFALALALSIAGIVLGIGLRTRAFLYVGVTFLVLNVLGQLLQLYPEQRLGRALLLMGLGSAITGLMIWFNIKREVIIERVRIFRADLESWD